MEIDRVVIIPSYLEIDSLPEFIHELDNLLGPEVGFVVIDDSPAIISSQIRLLCEKKLAVGRKFYFHSRNQKLGRGNAVIFGMAASLTLFPNALHFLECDADGSHRPKDIFDILNAPQSIDICIGSRYLPESSIIGWPWSRRIYSKTLNKVIPGLLGIPTTDVTNGLRRYSRQVATKLSESRFSTKGFMTLSEELLLSGESISHLIDIPITFVQRNSGVSSVTARQILQEFSGLIKLIYRFQINSKI